MNPETKTKTPTRAHRICPACAEILDAALLPQKFEAGNVLRTDHATFLWCPHRHVLAVARPEATIYQPVYTQDQAEVAATMWSLSDAVVESENREGKPAH